MTDTPQSLDLATAGAMVAQAAKIRYMKALIPDQAHPLPRGPWRGPAGSGFQMAAEGFADYERVMLQRVQEKCKCHALRYRRCDQPATLAARRLRAASLHALNTRGERFHSYGWTPRTTCFNMPICAGCLDARAGAWISRRWQEGVSGEEP